MSENIVLTGFMGVGKSTVGKILSKNLGMMFLDTDDEIEKRFGMTVHEIFEKHGEEKFRQSEAALAAELSEKSGLVIATGGGMVKSEQNIKNLRRNAVVVNLFCGVDKILSNIKDTSTRPLIHGKTREQVAELIESRTAYYRNADIRIATDLMSPAEVADAIEKLYKERSIPRDKIRNGRKPR